MNANQQEKDKESACSSADQPTTHTVSEEEVKRAAVRNLIERYFYQLQRGCGNPGCSNANCASSGKVANMSPNDLAAKAIQLFSHDAYLCPDYDDLKDTEMPSSSTTTRIPSYTEAHLSPTTSTSSSGGSSSTTCTNSTASTAAHLSLYDADDTLFREILDSTRAQPPKSSEMDDLEDGELISLRLEEGEIVSRPASLDTPTPASSLSHLDEQIFADLLAQCTLLDSWHYLVNALQDVFSNVDKLSKSFRKPTVQPTANASCLAISEATSKLDEILKKSPSDMKKEDIRTLEGENDKDIDSSCPPPEFIEIDDFVEPMEEAELPLPTNEELETETGDDDNADDGSQIGLDFEALRRFKTKLFAINNPFVVEGLNNGVMILSDVIASQEHPDWDKIVYCLAICFDICMNIVSNNFADMEYLEGCLSKICHAAHFLPVTAQARLARIWAVHCKDGLENLVTCCQQLITLRVIYEEDLAQDNQEVITLTKVLKMALHASILGVCQGTLKPCAAAYNDAESVTEPPIDEDDLFYFARIPRSTSVKVIDDQLEKELGISIQNARSSVVPFEVFYNEALSDAIQMDRDYLAYRSLTMFPATEGTNHHFSFMLHSFILTPATKVIALYYDSRIRMYSERNSSFYALMNYFDNGASGRPDLKIKVRRDHIVDDALIALELIATSSPNDLKKQLVVEFADEQGIDEGGISKEFFQLIIQEIFNPDYGMFIYQEDTKTMWFNATPFENDAQFTLIGIILGLAIYNNIILAVKFPGVVYRKLMGGLGTFHDLEDWNPRLHRSLKDLLDYEEADMEEVFELTFKIGYTDVFGAHVEHELKPGGAEMLVNQGNKREFVDMYADFMLNKNIKRQFDAFRRGFEMVTDESPLRTLFRPEEIELLVCGSPKFDFVELERSADYDGGYTRESQVIVNFWSVVHSWEEEKKRSLLQFATGSDRVPVGGLGRLKLLITRHGPDSDRLPTSHTCYNVLLLPEYDTKEKLEERLLKAITYSKGFGML